MTKEMKRRHLRRAIGLALLTYLLIFVSAIVLVRAGVPSDLIEIAACALSLVAIMPMVVRRCDKDMFKPDMAKVASVVADLKPMIVSYAALIGLFVVIGMLTGRVSLTTLLGTLAVATAYHVFVGIYEETMFRGLILDDALKGLSSTKHAVLLSAVLFALAHIPSFVIQGHILLVFFPRMLALALFGTILALERLRCGNVLGGIVVHSTTNIILALEGASSTASIAGTGDAWMILFCVVEIVALAKPTYRLWQQVFGAQKTAHAT